MVNTPIFLANDFNSSFFGLAVFLDYRTSKIGDDIASNPEPEENKTFETEYDRLKKYVDHILKLDRPSLVPIIDLPDEELKQLVKDQVVAFSDDGITRIPAEISKIERNSFTLCIGKKLKIRNTECLKLWILKSPLLFLWQLIHSGL